MPKNEIKRSNIDYFYKPNNEASKITEESTYSFGDTLIFDLFNADKNALFNIKYFEGLGFRNGKFWLEHKKYKNYYLGFSPLDSVDEKKIADIEAEIRDRQAYKRYGNKGVKAGKTVPEKHRATVFHPVMYNVLCMALAVLQNNIKNDLSNNFIVELPQSKIIDLTGKQRITISEEVRYIDLLLSKGAFLLSSMSLVEHKNKELDPLEKADNIINLFSGIEIKRNPLNDYIIGIIFKFSPDFINLIKQGIEHNQFTEYPKTWHALPNESLRVAYKLVELYQRNIKKAGRYEDHYWKISVKTFLTEYLGIDPSKKEIKATHIDQYIANALNPIKQAKDKTFNYELPYRKKMKIEAGEDKRVYMRKADFLNSDLLFKFSYLEEKYIIHPTSKVSKFKRKKSKQNQDVEKKQS